jgi:hypothetical protein
MIDMFEAAGCMLRLIMWPTELLWNDITQVYDEFGQNVGASSTNKKKKKAGRKKTKNKDNILASLNNEPSSSLVSGSFYQIGMHFRCGDRYSYAKFKLHTDGYDRHACIEDADSSHPKTLYMRAGNPVDIGKCAKSSYKNYDRLLQKQQRKFKRMLSTSGVSTGNQLFYGCC